MELNFLISLSAGEQMDYEDWFKDSFFLDKCSWICVCVCVWERESVRVCVCAHMQIF